MMDDDESFGCKRIGCVRNTRTGKGSRVGKSFCLLRRESRCELVSGMIRSGEIELSRNGGWDLLRWRRSRYAEAGEYFRMRPSSWRKKRIRLLVDSGSVSVNQLVRLLPDVGAPGPSV